MANAKRCDRCGKFYDKNLKYRGRKASDEFRSGVAYVTSHGFYGNTIDLCDDCLTKLDRFLGGVKLADEEE